MTNGVVVVVLVFVKIEKVKDSLGQGGFSRSNHGPTMTTTWGVRQNSHTPPKFVANEF